MTTDVIVVSARPSGVCDGVGDFASRLAAALRDAGTNATALAADEGGGWRALPDARGRAVILNYVPQDFARGGAAVVSAWLAAARKSGAPVVVVVHEFLPPRDTLRRRVAAIVLGRRLRRVLSRASSVVVTHQVAKDELAALGFAPSPVVIPVGSNIPVAPGTAKDGRGGTFVMFGQPASFAPALVRAIASGLAPEHEVRWLTRSAAEAETFCRVHGVEARRLNVLAGRDGTDVSAAMGSAAAALAPIVDGVSTRRSSVAAALAHALPVVGTDGACTTAALRDSGAFLLTAPDDAEGLVAHARVVASGGSEAAMMSQAASRLHGEVFAWPRIAAAYLEVLKPS